MSVSFRSAALIAACLAVAVPMPAAACSTCKCGDYSITLLGAEKPYAGRLRGAIELLARSESQGGGLDRRETGEWRTTLGLSYALTDDLTLALQLPWVRKRIDDANLARLEADGLGDADLIGWWVLHRDGGATLRHLAGLRIGVRLPTADEIASAGRPLDIDVQPDAGATAPNLGGWYRYFRFPWLLSASAVYFAYGDGRQGFAPGDALTLSLLGQYALDQDWALQLGIDGRHSARNAFSGVADPDSGGTLLAVHVGVVARRFGELSLGAGVQLPILDRLDGAQREDPALRVSLAYDF